MDTAEEFHCDERASDLGDRVPPLSFAALKSTPQSCTCLISSDLTRTLLGSLSRKNRYKLDSDERALSALTVKHKPTSERTPARSMPLNGVRA